MIQTLRRRKLLLIAAGLGASAAAACAPSPAPPEAKPTPPATAPKAATRVGETPAAKVGATTAPAKTVQAVKVKLGFIRGIFDGAYMLGARDSGVYEKNGIDMELVTFQDDVTTTRALLGKEILVGEISFQNPLSVIEKGSPVKIVGVSYAKVPFVFLARKEIKSLKDLEGKSSGIGAINDFNHQLQLAVLRKAGLGSIDLNFVPIGPTPQIVQALVAGKIDAGTGLFSQEIQLRGNPDIHVLADISQELPNMPRFGPVTTQESIEKEHMTLDRFMIAHSAAWRWAMENRDAIVKAAVQHLALDEKVAAGAYDAPLTREGMITPAFTLSTAQLQQVQELNLAAGLQSKPVPFEQAADLRYVKSIADKLGPYQVPVKKS